MFNIVELSINAFVADVLLPGYERAFIEPQPKYQNALEGAARLVFESIANTDASYHDMDHTMQVTMVGQQIMLGRLVTDGSITHSDWFNYILSLLYHDIGYLRGVCPADRNGAYWTGENSEPVRPPSGSTDAFMTPWHVDRGKQFIRKRFGSEELVNTEDVCRNIERTRFPVPADSDSKLSDDIPGLVRAADLIGQLADPRYPQKFARLYAEFAETGEAKRLGYADAGELREGYPGFFWNVIKPYINEAIHYLQRTQRGQQILARLYSTVYAEEHGEPAFGPERRAAEAIPPNELASGARRKTDRGPAV